MAINLFLGAHISLRGLLTRQWLNCPLRRVLPPSDLANLDFAPFVRPVSATPTHTDAMPTPGLANAAVAAGRSIRALNVPSLFIQDGTTSATWEVRNPIVGAALQYFSTSPPDEVVAGLKQALAHAGPIVVDRPGETLITVPVNHRFAGPRGTKVEGDLTFSVGRFDREEDPTISESIRSVIGADYVADTRPLATNAGVREFAAGVLEDAVFRLATPLDRDGSNMQRPSEVARQHGGARTAVDASEVWEVVGS